MRAHIIALFRWGEIVRNRWKEMDMHDATFFFFPVMLFGIPHGSLSHSTVTMMMSERGGYKLGQVLPAHTAGVILN